MAINDRSIYVEAHTGDGGNHVTQPLWLSDDLFIEGNNGQALTGGTVNKVKVRVHKKVGVPTSGETVKVDVYAGDPSMVMTPTTGTTKLTNAANRPNLFVDPNTLTPAGVLLGFDWVLQNTPAEQPGHKCLIAQCYPDSDSPDNTPFNVVDQHVAQHNIAVLQMPPAPPHPAPQPFRFNVHTVNQNHAAAERVTVRAAAVRNPSANLHHLLVNNRLIQPLPGFHAPTPTAPVIHAAPPILATRINAGFGLGASGVQFTNIVDKTGGHQTFLDRLFGRAPAFQAQLALQPAQVTTVTFTTDLSQLERNKTHVFEMTQAGSNGHLQGGITLVLVPHP